MSTGFGRGAQDDDGPGGDGGDGGVTIVSSFVIVPVAWARPSVAPDGLLSVTMNVSPDSSVVSPQTATSIVLDVCPGAIVSVLFAAT